jgi:serine/threonine protein kinase
MLSGNPPFQIADINDWWFKQLATNRPERFWKAHISYYPKFPKQSMTILGRMFQPNPKYRYTVKEVSQDMWMQLHKLNENELYTEMRQRKLQVEQAKLLERKKALASKEASQNAAATFCKDAGSIDNVTDPFKVKVSRSIQPETFNDTFDKENKLPPLYESQETEIFTNNKFYQIYTGSDGITVIDKILSLIMTHNLFKPISVFQKKDAFSYSIKGANVEFTLNVYREITEKFTQESNEKNCSSDYITLVQLDRIEGDMFSFGLMFKLIHHTISQTRVRFNSDIVVIQDDPVSIVKDDKEISPKLYESILGDDVYIF